MNAEVASRGLQCGADRRAIVLALMLVAVLPLGCAGPGVRPEISNRGTSLRFPESQYCTVLPGDTLYSIAWENGRDFRDLAQWNGIAAPYTIHPGERLRLFPPQRRYRVYARRPPVPATAYAAPRPAARSPAPASVVGATRYPSKVGPWVWPAEGRITARFNPAGMEDGVEIAGRLGEPVLAAAAGKVVYQGSGLRGYGQLIIIKHNAEYLSAYAHNERILVKEGEIVRPGQEIAEMGDTGTNRVELLFEIRRDGSPVDPKLFFPNY